MTAPDLGDNLPAGLEVPAVSLVGGGDCATGQDATAVSTGGGCEEKFLGWRFTGTTCQVLYGCACSGADCDAVATQTSQELCLSRHKSCCTDPTPTPTEGPSPTPTPGPSPTAPVDPTATPTQGPSTHLSCNCWPQDIEATPAGCPDPDQILGYKHNGHGICVPVKGCSLGGSEAGQIFGSLEACEAAFADCACEDCDPWPTPIPLPTETAAACDNCAPGTEYMDWHDWYPMDRGQKPGERAINWWTSPGPLCLRGQSTYNFPGIPKGMPADLAGQCVDYYLNWGCQNSDADCNDYSRHVEIISERRNGNGNAIYLDHWGYGSASSWLTFFDPNALGSSGCGCTIENVSALTAAQRQAARLPETLLLSCNVGKWAYGNVVCAARYVTGANGEAAWEEGRLGDWPIGDEPRDAVALMVVRTKVIAFLQDSWEVCNVAHVVNEYLTTGCGGVEEECKKLRPGDPADPRCEELTPGSGSFRARRFTFESGDLLVGLVPPLPTPGAGTPTATPPACDGCGNTWCIDRREEYYLRRVPPETLLEGGEYRRINGFNGFGWKTFLLCALDECPYWYIDPVGGALTAATPTAGPSPTPGSPTAAPATTPTPLPLEDDAWETRCRNEGGDCSSNPSATPHPFCAQDIPTPIPAQPGGGPDNACGVTPWPPPATAVPTGAATTPAVPSATPPPGQGTAWPTRTPAAVPTDAVAATCVPSPTPTATATVTPSPTATATATPLPTCTSDVATRTCPSEACNPSWCWWTVPTLSFGPLLCDGQPGQVYTVEVTAFQCDIYSLLKVEVKWKENGVWGPLNAMTKQYTSPQQWKYTGSSPVKPTEYRLRYWFPDGQQRLTIDTLQVKISCGTCGS